MSKYVVKRVKRQNERVPNATVQPDVFSFIVARYELVGGRNIKDVRELLVFASTGTNHSRITTEIVPAIKDAGETETFLWDMGDTSTGTSFAFAIRAVDNAGNWATISNVATAGV